MSLKLQDLTDRNKYGIKRPNFKKSSSLPLMAPWSRIHQTLGRGKYDHLVNMH